MSSTCQNTITLSPQKHSSYRWLTHRLSVTKSSDPVINDPDLNQFDGFEFCVEDPVAMLPADELFSNGKLLPLHFSSIRPETATSATTNVSLNNNIDNNNNIMSVSSCRKIDMDDVYFNSPRAPTCSSRWKELLGFRKLILENKRTKSLASSKDATCQSEAPKSIRQLLYRSTKSSITSSNNASFVKESDTESVISSRPSLSSSSSSDDVPRLSLDIENRGKLHCTRTRRTTSLTGQRRRSSADVTTTFGMTNDSPRLNSSGKIVFNNLARSSSSPCSLNGGPRLKQRGVERSYSGNVRVINVPVCSLKGFPKFGSQHKREGSSGSSNGGSNRGQRVNSGKF